MKKLKLADDLSLPLAAVTQKLAWIGTTGSGKTYGASKLAELMWDAGAQFVALDPVGVWYGLRLAADGKKPSDVTIPVFGGLHGDVPIEPTGGALLADLIIDRAISAVLDVSQFETDADKARFATGFVDRFFFRKKASPSAVHLFLEECQEFVPENEARGEERMKHGFVRMQKIGRNFGIGTSLITQRPQDVSKKALNLAGTLFVFRTTGKHERKAIEAWIADKAIADQDIGAELPKLKTGRPHVWSPEWLAISEVVGVLEKRTFNASATPEVGAAAVARQLAPIDLERIRTDMAATIEKAKADDPKLLREQLVKVQRQLAAAQKTPAVRVEPRTEVTVERVAVPMLTEEHVKALREAAGAIQQTFAAARGLVEQLAQDRGALTDALTAIDRAIAQATRPMPAPKQVARSGPLGAKTQPARVRPMPPAADPGALEGIGNVEQRILDHLAELEALGLTPTDKRQLGLFAGYTNVRSGGFSEPMGRLVKAGLVESPRPGTVVLSATGRLVAQPANVPATTEALQERIMAALDGPQAKLLRELLAIYPSATTKAELGERCGYTNTRSGGFSEPLGNLRTLGLVEYPNRGEVRAAPALFLEGVA